MIPILKARNVFLVIVFLKDRILLYLPVVGKKKKIKLMVLTIINELFLLDIR